MCAKVRYLCRKHAKQNKPKHQNLHAYKCPECGLWHLGHMPAKVKAGKVSISAYYGRSRALEGAR